LESVFVASKASDLLELPRVHVVGGAEFSEFQKNLE